MGWIANCKGCGKLAKVWQDGHCEECQANIDANKVDPLESAIKRMLDGAKGGNMDFSELIALAGWKFES